MSAHLGSARKRFRGSESSARASSAPSPTLIPQGDTLRIDPRVPEGWRELSVGYRFGDSLYAITVQDPAELSRADGEVILDGRPIDGALIPLQDDGAPHEVVVRPPRQPPAPPMESGIRRGAPAQS